jgi:hypothetical protein
MGLDDELPGDRSKKFVIDASGIGRVLVLPWELVSDKIVQQIYRYRCNGNQLKVADLLERRHVFAGKVISIKAARDREEPYFDRGILAPGVFYVTKKQRTPIGVLLTQQTQRADVIVPVYFDRIRGVIPYSTMPY